MTPDESDDLSYPDPESEDHAPDEAPAEAGPLASEALAAIAAAPEDPLVDPVAQAFVRPGRVKPFVARHPWVLDKAIGRIEGTPQDGDVVDLVDPQGRFLARGLFNSQSQIRLRLYTWDAGEALDESFFARRLEAAIAWREQLGLLAAAEGGARLVFSESDGLSGLVVDRYGEWLAVQVTSLGVARRMPWVLELLQRRLQPRGIYVRTEKGVSQNEGLRLIDGLVAGEPSDGPVFITEHGLRYGVDLGTGQKTGFYLDQRDNRLAAAAYAKDRRVLDVFCYSGGFALNALHHGGAREVLGVDSSEKAVRLARANAQLNSLQHVSFQTADAFDALNSLVTTRERFGLVILDPPKFARNRARVDDALRAYHRINRMAVDLLEPGGVLVTSSCSGHVLREDMLAMLAGVSQRTRRPLQIIEQRGASADHPVSATCLETEYLKCVVCRAL